MSDMSVLLQALKALKNKRRELAAVIASGEGALSDLSIALNNVQIGIEAITKAIEDENEDRS